MTNKPFTEPGCRRIAKPRPVRYCANCAASLVATRAPQDYGHTTCHTCRAEQPVAINHMDGEDRADRQLRAMRLLGELPKTITPETRPAKPPKERCEFYPIIRGFYAAAQAVGLNVNASARMRQALGCFLRRPVASRRELSANDWSRATYAVERGELIW